MTELGHVDLEPASNSIVTAIAANTDTPVASPGPLAVTATVGVEPVLARVFLPHLAFSAAGVVLTLRLWRGSTLIQAATHHHPTANGPSERIIEVRDSPPPGEYTYELKFRSVVAGNVTLLCGPGFPAWMGIESR